MLETILCCWEVILFSTNYRCSDDKTLLCCLFIVLILVYVSNIYIRLYII